MTNTINNTYHTKGLYVYDIEQFRNFHCLCALDVHTGKRKTFVIHSSRDDRFAYISWLNKNAKALIGYNNLNYDYPILHKILGNKNYFLSASIEKVTRWLKDLSDEIIKAPYSQIYSKYVRIPQIDLYKLNHFDNKAKATSLKWVQFATRWKNLVDIPLPPDSMISDHDVSDVLKYCHNDISSTYYFYLVCRGKVDLPLYKGKDALDLRFRFGHKHGINMINYNDTKIGSEILLTLYCNKTGQDKEIISKLRTYRQQINLSECILPYVEFKTSEFSAILDFLKSKKIKKTKSTFDNIDLNKYPELEKFSSKETSVYKRKEHKAKKLNVVYQGLRYDYGTGGIHASKTGIFTDSPTHIIIDSDVGSLYPSLAIVNNLFPEHLGKEFIDVYKNDIVDVRLKCKKLARDNTLSEAERRDHDAISEMLKLASNSAYGKSNSDYSFLYDPKFTMSIENMWWTLKVVNCWNILKFLTLQRKHEIKLSVIVHKSQKIVISCPIKVI